MCVCGCGGIEVVSTHSRPKAAGPNIKQTKLTNRVSTHSRPKAAGRTSRPFLSALWLFQHTAARRRLAYDPQYEWGYELVSTHSRPKAAGRAQALAAKFEQVSTHSRPKAAGAVPSVLGLSAKAVSTHSRPKAAGIRTVRLIRCIGSFNTQPPEGGWVRFFAPTPATWRFNTQPPEGGWNI